MESHQYNNIIETRNVNVRFTMFVKVWTSKGTGVSLLLSIAAGIMPAWKASRLSPLEALRRT